MRATIKRNISTFKFDSGQMGLTFKNLMSQSGVNGGFHRFVLRINGLKKNNIMCKFKFGVSKELFGFEDPRCFSDTDNGFSFFSIGQTRNGSNSSGLLYHPGKKPFGRVTSIYY